MNGKVLKCRCQICMEMEVLIKDSYIGYVVRIAS